MKKVALLLGALALVSSVAYAKEVVPAVEEVVVVEEVKAAPMLRVTSFGQGIEVDNYSKHSDEYGLDHDDNDIGKVMLSTSVGLAYGDDWTFNFMARKHWDTDTDEGMRSDGYRIDMEAWRAFENYSLGLKWRQESDNDKYYIRGKYHFGMFSGWADFAYKSVNGEGSDSWYSEAMPIAITYGPVTVGYYYEWDKYTTTDNVDDTKEGSLKHQVRVMAPLYTGEKLSLTGEYRYQFAEDKDYTVDTPWVENNRHIVIVGASYAVTDRLGVSGYYEYDFNKYEKHDGAKDVNDDYYGEFGLGWTYSF